MMKLSKYDLCKKCRKIHPKSDTGTPVDYTIEDWLDGEMYNNPETAAFVVLNEAILIQLQKYGCPECINIFKHANDSIMYPIDFLNALRKKANSGDIDAMLSLYSKLCFMYGSERNEMYNTEANQLIEKAAKLGNEMAQFELAIIYRDERNDESNYFKWIEKSAKNGYTKAKHNLAVDYLINGQNKEAFYWMEQASNEGHASATFKLSKLYFDGTGVSANREKAISLMHKAADMGDENAKEFLASVYR